MVNLRSGAAVRQLDRCRPFSLRRLPTIDAVVTEQRPENPMFAVRPATLRATAAAFVERFPGDVLYAVKCNPEPTVLRALWDGGVRHFDCASLNEVRLVRRLLPEAGIYFMHPIKSVAAIRESFVELGVRDFSFDHHDELDKILAIAGDAAIGLHLRLGMPKSRARYDLSGKFGAYGADAVSLLRRAKAHAARVGICFHVGSQCMEVDSYREATLLAAATAEAAGVQLDVLDIGGGFPVAYPDMTPPSLEAFIGAVREALPAFGPVTPHLWCEPGRALVADAGSVIVRIEARRGNVLHLNDGAFGNLYDLKGDGLCLPARVIRLPGEAAPTGAFEPFSFYGPTCDTADQMEGPFLLPADIAVGDYIELGTIGSYSVCLRTAFNGFDQTLFAQVSDAPLAATLTHDLADAIRQAA